jgi:hypothetical protein
MKSLKFDTQLWKSMHHSLIQHIVHIDLRYINMFDTQKTVWKGHIVFPFHLEIENFKVATVASVGNSEVKLL